MTDTQVDNEVEAIVRLYRAYGDQIAELERGRKELQTRFRDITEVGYAAHVDGKPAAHLPPNRAFHLETAMLIASASGIEIRTVPDTSDLRERLRALGRLDDAMLPGSGEARVVMG